MAKPPLPKSQYLISNFVNFPKQFRNRNQERRQRDHMSRQFTYVSHGTLSHIPPHELEGSEEFHVGTQSSAHTRMAQYGNAHRYNHVYRISRDAMSPVVFGDYLNRPENLDEPMSGVQPSLWENTAFNSPEAEKYQKDSNLVLPYRNQQEDRGSVSFVVPKGRVGNGVEYLGRWDSHREPVTEEDKARVEFLKRDSVWRDEP
jgi:hypothetical protein